MTKQTSHRPHVFITNMLGAIGHVATVFVWLLVFDLIVILSSFSWIVDNVSRSINSASAYVYPTTISTTTTQTQSVISGHPLMQFFLIVLLAVLVWIFSYFVARASSAVLRHMLVLFGRKSSFALFDLAKYLAICMGIIGLVVLLQFVHPINADIKLPIAFLGLAAGTIGVGAIWAQRVLAERYLISIDKIL